MPTTEWLEKYEKIRKNLSSNMNLDAYFTEKAIGNVHIDTLNIGTVHFPTGTIFACDPLIELSEAQPYIQTVPAGTYPVTICVVPARNTATATPA